jgi:hypothetical protein
MLTASCAAPTSGAKPCPRRAQARWTEGPIVSPRCYRMAGAEQVRAFAIYFSSFKGVVPNLQLSFMPR